MDTLTILYTQNINGNLQILPSLYTFLQSLKQDYDPQALILDIGDACSDDVWHCDVTDGRSAVIVMDAMAYHAVNVTGFMTDSQRDSLGNSVSVGLITARHMWRYFVPPLKDDDIVIAGQATPAMRLCIVANPHTQNSLNNRMLELQQVEQSQIGLVQVDMHKLAITEQNIFYLPKGTKPNPTISASVDLVMEEAEFISKRR